MHRSFNREIIRWTSESDETFIDEMQLQGTISRIVTVPGTVAPKVNYDIVLVYGSGDDVREGALAI